MERNANVSSNIPMPFFIAFSGKKQVGKDTATVMAVEMLEEAGKKVAVTAFAELLKEVCIKILGVPEELVYGTNEDKDTQSPFSWDNLPEHIRKKYGTDTVPRTGHMTVRELLQVVGTDIFREMFDYDVWANAPFNQDWANKDVVILTDCRFPNEKRAVESRDGLVIRLTRKTDFQDNHVSETALDGVKFGTSYANDGDYDNLNIFIESTLIAYNLI